MGYYSFILMWHLFKCLNYYLSSDETPEYLEERRSGLGPIGVMQPLMARLSTGGSHYVVAKNLRIVLTDQQLGATEES